VHAYLKWTDIFGGCWHRQLSFPFTPRPGQPRAAAAQQTGTYVVCLKCGQQLPYDWNQMRIVPSGTRESYPHHVMEAESHN
jgi:hypothetical protein